MCVRCEGLVECRPHACHRKPGSLQGAAMLKAQDAPIPFNGPARGPASLEQGEKGHVEEASEPRRAECAAAVLTA
jgi:hypothetical protein